jgi:hypothetical protein
MHRKESLTAILTWANSERIASTLLVPIGEVEIKEWWGEWLSYLINLVKDFALPILLGFLAYWYQRRERRRDQQALAEETRREQARQEQDRLRTQIAETWDKMLPESHRLATQHYMGLERQAQEAVEYITGFLRDGNREKARMGFYYVVLLGRRIRHLNDSAGGFYFKNRIGEKLVARCLDEYMNLYFYSEEAMLRRFSTLLDHVNFDEKPGSFLKKLDGEGSPEIVGVFKRAWDDFETWVKSEECQNALPFVRAFGAILKYEMNRPYEHWYGNRERLVIDANMEAKILQLAEKIGQETGQANFRAEVVTYLQDAKSQP